MLAIQSFNPTDANRALNCKLKSTFVGFQHPGNRPENQIENKGSQWSSRLLKMQSNTFMIGNRIKGLTVQTSI